MTFAVEESVASDPAAVGLLGADSVTYEADGGAGLTPGSLGRYSGIGYTLRFDKALV